MRSVRLSCEVCEIHISLGAKRSQAVALVCPQLAALGGKRRECVLTDDTKLAVQHRPRREDERRVDDGIGHQNDELLRHKPAHVAHRQLEAVPEEPEEQRIDVLQIVSEQRLFEFPFL